MHFNHQYNASVDLIDRHLAEGRENNVAVRTPHASWTYAELAAAVNRAGNVLHEFGVEIENRVFICLEDGFEAVAAIFGAIKIGAVPTVHAPGMPAEVYRHILEDSRAKLAIVTSSSVEAVREASQGLPHFRRLLVAGSGADDHAGFSSLLANASAELTAADTCRDDVVLFQYTSGTTGKPKAAVHLQHDLRAGVKGLGELFEVTERDVVLCAARLNAAVGFAVSLCLSFSFGATSCLFSGPPAPPALSAAIRSMRPTVFLGLNSSYAGLLAVPHLDVSSIRICITGAEPMSIGVFEQWREATGIELIEGIGSTESMAAYIANRPGDIRPGTLGRVVPGFEVRLVDEHGANVAPGQPGEAWLKAESLLAYYWHDQALSDRVLVGGWCRTGDVLRIDDDGRYVFLGRRDDMFKIGGFWVNPREVELVLERHPLVQRSGVARTGDDITNWAEAFVVLVADADINSAKRELMAHVRELPAHARPRAIHFVDDLPRTAIGKLRRDGLNALRTKEG